jgi:hypothetical protein
LSIGLSFCDVIEVCLLLFGLLFAQGSPLLPFQLRGDPPLLTLPVL